MGRAGTVERRRVRGREGITFRRDIANVLPDSPIAGPASRAPDPTRPVRVLTGRPRDQGQRTFETF